MIVRDEQERIARCLAAAKPFVDEIVVVDTGSRDDTVAIARSFGARIVNFPWCDDFAAARNASIDAASGDWLLFLDADEVLSKGAGTELRRMLQRKRTLGAYIPLRDEGDGAPKIITLLFRAVRRRKDIRWRYRLHEQLLPDAIRIAKAEGLVFETLSGEIRHDGYCTAVMESKGKRARNDRIFEAQLADTPEDPYVLYKFGDSLRSNEATFPRAMELLQRSLTTLKQLPSADCHELTFAGEVCALLALGQLRCGNSVGAAATLDFGERNCRQTGHLAYARGQQCLSVNDAAAALQAFRACATHKNKAMLIPATARVSGLLAKVGEARALIMLGRAPEALVRAREALAVDATDPDAMRAAADAALAQGDLRTAVSFAMDALAKNPDNGDAWLCGALVLFRAKLFSKSVDWCNRAATLLADKASAAALLGECWLHLQRTDAAREAFALCPTDPRCVAGLAVVEELEGSSVLTLLQHVAAAERQRMMDNLRSVSATV